MCKILALHGGESIRQYKKWPAWPEYQQTALSNLESVLKSRRWAISGVYTGTELLSFQFAKKFAKYIGTSYCITTDHGSSSLVMSLQALGIGYGDEVIVPGLTWVACATSVIRVNGIPVLVDVDPCTLCIDPNAVEEAITPKTAAILVVHLYSAMANMDELIKISNQYGIPIIEDCAQAHGALWNDRKAGSIGIIGTFSMQQGKILTCGEGGAVVTSDSYFYKRLEQLSNDGRSFSTDQPIIGHQQFKECGNLIGSNFAISEFQSAILLDGLELLDSQNARRAENASYLAEKIKITEGLYNIEPLPQNKTRAYYHFVVKINPDMFDNKPIGKICEALEAELGIWVHSSYTPLNNHPLYRPHKDERLKKDSFLQEQLDPQRYELPVCKKQSQIAIVLHHSCLLGTKEDMDDIIAAFEKVREFSCDL